MQTKRKMQNSTIWYEVKLLPWANSYSMLTESIDLLFNQVLTNLLPMGHAIRTAPPIQEVPLVVTVAKIGEGEASYLGRFT